MGAMPTAGAPPKRDGAAGGIAKARCCATAQYGSKRAASSSTFAACGECMPVASDATDGAAPPPRTRLGGRTTGAIGTTRPTMAGVIGGPLSLPPTLPP